MTIYQVLWDMMMVMGVGVVLLVCAAVPLRAVNKGVRSVNVAIQTRLSASQVEDIEDVIWHAIRSGVTFGPRCGCSSCDSAVRDVVEKIAAIAMDESYGWPGRVIVDV